MNKFPTDFEDKVVLTTRVKRLTNKLEKIWKMTTKILQRRDIPETAKDQIREIRKEADNKEEEEE